jgi:phosphatidylglycerophosphatase A
MREANNIENAEENILKSNLILSNLVETIFYWLYIKKWENDSLEDFFRLRRIIKMLNWHGLLLIEWIKLK